MKAAMIQAVLTAALFSARLEAAPAEFPVAFDLRDYNGENFVTSVKSQDGGTCWTHGTMASIEGNLLMTGAWEEAGEEGEPNLAEYHLDWWNGFNMYNNDDTDPPSGGGLEVHMGGDYMVSTAYLSRGEGAVRDIDGQSFDSPPGRSSDSYHYYYPLRVDWMTIGDNLEGIEKIKQALMDHGVVGTCMCYSDQFIQDYIHYQPPDDTTDPNHAVAIIGWNDTLTTQAPLPGAWLVKNSWGSGWGLDGFFWISYYDKWSCRQPEMGAVSFQDIVPMPWDTIFCHDYHGFRDTMEGCQSAMNAFSAGKALMVEASGFFVPEDSTDYTVSIYSGMAGGEPAGLLSQVQGFADQHGYRTIELPEALSLAEGDSFFVRLDLSAGGQPYDRTSDVPVLLGASYRTIVESSAQPGQSWYLEDGEWKDFYGWEGNPYPGTGNFCIKAMAQNYGISLSPEVPLAFAGPVGGPFEPEAGELVLHNNTGGSIQYGISMSPSESWLSIDAPQQGVLSAGDSLPFSIGPGDDALVLGPGAYEIEVSFTNLTDHSGDTSIPVTLLIGDPEPFQSWDMSSDPGWDPEGLWQWGVPLGQGGEHGYPDPGSGFTGSHVYGYNLAGDYENYLAPTRLSTGVIDCSDMRAVHLRFMRRLGVQGGFDSASLAVSLGDHEGTTLWANPIWPDVADSDWVQVEYDLSGIADGQPEVYISWVMGPTNDGWTFCGWNLDDVELLGLELRPGTLLPSRMVLGPVVPNPIRTGCTLTLVMPSSGLVRTAVFDLSGRVVAEPFEGLLGRGSSELSWDGRTDDGRRLPAGLYVIRARSPFGDATSKAVLLP